MSNEEIVDELLHEAEILKIREDVIELASRLLERNPLMERSEAFQTALKHLKLFL